MANICKDDTSLKAANAAKPHPAPLNNFLKIMHTFLQWCVDWDFLETNVAHGVAKIRTKSDGHEPWTVEEVEQARAYWKMGTRQRIAIELLYATGLRRSDAVLGGRQHIKNGVLSIFCKKTDVWVHPPMTDELERAIEAGPTGDLALIVTKSGRSMTEESFGNWFGNLAREAGVPKTAHGMRKLCATLVAEGGATDREMMSMFGWTSASQVAVYTKNMDRRKLGASAGAKMKLRLGNKSE